MEAASRPEFEPLTEAGPEMPAAPAVLPPPAVNRLLEQAPTVAVPAPSTPAAAAAAAASAAAAAAAPSNMDRDFIARNQIVERYLSGKLPIKGATDFERFCKANPDLLDTLGVPERVNAALRLLEASGKPEPWAEAPKKFYEKPHLAIGLGVALLAALIGLAIAASGSSEKTAKIASLQKAIAEQPLEPATSTRTIRLLPSFKGSTNTPAVVVGGLNAQLADMRLDLSRSAYRNFRITIDRIDQGRVGILHNVQKDSNGHVRISLNSSALGPGNYQFAIEGLTWKGEPVPEAWITVGITRQ